MVAERERVRDTVDEPCWAIARDVETAEAFADWCVENGIEDPQIALIDGRKVERILSARTTILWDI